MQPSNLLPYDGEAFYFPNWIEQPNQLFQEIYEEISWSPDQGVMFGKPYITERKMAWLAPSNLPYTYSGYEHQAQKIPPCLELIFKKVKILFPEVNSCLANYYPHGKTSMGYHADNEKELGKNPTILSISLGAKRKFKFKHSHLKTVIDIKLGNGSLLLMQGKTQHFWKHSLPISSKIQEPRINLTFRSISK